VADAPDFAIGLPDGPEALRLAPAADYNRRPVPPPGSTRTHAMTRPSPAFCLALGLLASKAGAAEESTPLPKVPAGWKVELVTQAPAIAYPTAVVAAPDGTIYLGQDPMDMPGPVNRPIDSVVAIKDGKVRVFAEKLWSVMGLEWIDDTLYVVHAPFLSAFRDTDGDGLADSRVDLITGLGPKVPGFSGLNDHVASGLRLGMDGFLYIAVGDKGIYEGVGKDKAKIQLHGGGVIRIRPDGTGLEVVSTGERNPLSVALTATDEIFTYGNDDDGKKWPNSLTHHIVGGHYGYPYQFLDHPERCLPIVGGELGGAGAQGVCYNEDGLPARYRGNLFFADWGLQRVDRFVVAKAGGTFKLVTREPFITRGDLADFRPFSLCVTPDGAGFYLVDWAYPGWLADGPKTGRLYRVSYEGADKPTPAPRPEGAGLASLPALNHPALAVRLQAQRAILKKAAEEKIDRITFEMEVLKSIRNLAGDAPGQLHAIWMVNEKALKVSVVPEAGEGQDRGLLVDYFRAEKSPEVRLQAVRCRGIRNEPEPSNILLILPVDPRSSLKDRDAAVRREAAIALGRVGDRGTVPALMAALGDPDPFVDWSIRRALRTLNAWGDGHALTAALLDPRRRESALKLADETWSVPVVEALYDALAKTRDVPGRARIVTVLAGLYRQYPAWSGNWFGTNPLAGEFPRRTQDWDKTAMERVLDGLAKGTEDADATVRAAGVAGLMAAGKPAAPILWSRLGLEADPANLAAIARGLGALNDYKAIPGLAALAQDGKRPISVRAAALDALAGFRGPDSLKARFAVAFDPRTPSELVAQVLPPLGRSGALPANDLAGFVDRPEGAVRAAALLTIAGLNDVPPFVAERVVGRLDDPDPDARKAAIAAVANLKLDDAVPGLLTLAGDDAYRTEATLGLCALRDPRALDVYFAAIGDRNPDLRRAGAAALAAVGEAAAPAIEAKARAGTLNGGAALAVERALTRFKPVADWRVIGPFARTTPTVFVGEPAIAFGRVHLGAGEQPIAWTPAEADPATGRVVLDDLKAGAGDRGGFGYDTNGSPDLAAFGFAEISAEQDRPALLLIGSSGGLLVTLNERVVLNYSNFAGRAYAADSDLVPVRLKAGKNRLLVKSRQGIGAWSFGVQVSEPSAGALAARPPGFDPELYRGFAAEHDGNARFGEALFFDARGIGCARCHAANGRGKADLGPDLTGLALKYDKSELIRSVLEPSARIATGYQPVLVATADGKVHSGLVRAESAAHLDLADADGKVTRIDKPAIEERRVGDVSLMPAGLVEPLSPQEFADLIGYLQSLKAAPVAAGH